MGKMLNSLHQIWLQGGSVTKPLDGFVQHIAELCAAAGWSYTLWTAQDMERLSKKSSTMFYMLSPKCCNITQQSNIARYLILRDYGGLYLDTDVELCLLPGQLEGAWIPATSAMHGIGSFALACPSHHPWVERIVSMCTEIDLGISCSAGSKLVAKSKGPDVNVWPKRVWSNRNGQPVLGTHAWRGHSMGHFSKPPVLQGEA